MPNACFHPIKIGLRLQNNPPTRNFSGDEGKVQQEFRKTQFTVIAMGCPTGTSFEPSGAKIFAKKL